MWCSVLLIIKMEKKHHHLTHIYTSYFKYEKMKNIFLECFSVAFINNLLSKLMLQVIIQVRYLWPSGLLSQFFFLYCFRPLIIVLIENGISNLFHSYIHSCLRTKNSINYGAFQNEYILLNIQESSFFPFEPSSNIFIYRNDNEPFN